MKNTLLLYIVCLAFLVVQEQACRAEVQECRFTSNDVDYSTKEIEGRRPKAFNVIASFSVDFYHRGQTIADKKTYTKSYDVAADTVAKATQRTQGLVFTFCEEEKIKQCKEKQCDSNN